MACPDVEAPANLLHFPQALRTARTPPAASTISEFRSARRPERLLADVKRLLSRRWRSPAVQAEVTENRRVVLLPSI
jgi:hypothetical protein